MCQFINQSNQLPEAKNQMIATAANWKVVQVATRPGLGRWIIPAKTLVTVTIKV